MQAKTTYIAGKLLDRQIKLPGIPETTNKKMFPKFYGNQNVLAKLVFNAKMKYSPLIGRNSTLSYSY